MNKNNHEKGGDKPQCRIVPLSSKKSCSKEEMHQRTTAPNDLAIGLEELYQDLEVLDKQLDRANNRQLKNN